MMASVSSSTFLYSFFAVKQKQNQDGHRPENVSASQRPPVLRQDQPELLEAEVEGADGIRVRQQIIF